MRIRPSKYIFYNFWKWYNIYLDRRIPYKEIQWIRDQQAIFIKINRLSLPERAVHNDAKIGNILFDKKSGLACAVIDWDTTMRGSVLSDFGDMVRTISTTTAEDDPDLSAILTKVERENLLLGASIFNWTRNKTPKAHFIDSANKWI